MVEIKIKRNKAESGPGYTHGRLFVDECGFLCWTLEDQDRGLTQDMPTEKIKTIKVYGKTAIPTGRYRIELRVSQKFKDRPWCKKFGGMIPYILDVPGFDGVAIHPFNSPEESLGCIGPGELHGTIRGRIFSSTKAYGDIMEYYLVPAHERKDEIWITIE